MANFQGDKQKVRQILDAVKKEGRDSLTAPEGKLVCDAYGISVPKEGVVGSAKEAMTLSASMGFPVVMKIVSPDILHKTEAGGVVVGVKSADEAASAYDQIIANARKYKADAKIVGVQVQQMIKGGQEVIVGKTGERILFDLRRAMYAHLQRLSMSFMDKTEVGRLLHETIDDRQEINGARGQGRFTASMIVAGQIKGMEPRLFLVYPEGNFIEASWDTPFFQIGETKYGRPILIRGYDRKMSFEDAVKLLMVSFDSTLKANLSVGLPLDLLVVRRGEYEPLHERRIEHADSYFTALSSSWSDALRDALHSLPGYSFHPDN